LNYIQKLLGRLKGGVDLEAETMREEMMRAESVAKCLRPSPPPKTVGIEIGFFHRSLFEASGDWYAFEQAGDGRYLHVIMCDAAGHGLQAAFVVAACKSALDLIKLDRPDHLNSNRFLAEYAFRLNHVLYSQGNGSLVTTITGVTIDLESDTSYYIGAGNPLPLHMNSIEGTFENFTKGKAKYSLPGATPDLQIQADEFKFLKGDDLIFFTDGIPFPRTAKKSPELFVVEEWENVQRRLNELMDQIFINKVKKELIGQDDDMTCLWIRRSNEENEEKSDPINMRRIS
jgi:serine phosphatase RsbU (regulator of sigma subunit)